MADVWSSKVATRGNSFEHGSTMQLLCRSENETYLLFLSEMSVATEVSEVTGIVVWVVHEIMT